MLALIVLVQSRPTLLSSEAYICALIFCCPCTQVELNKEKGASEESMKEKTALIRDAIVTQGLPGGARTDRQI